ncbi:hypothetical protein ABL78_0198 [Leptomonas seymouri]|uniref:Uncharacterized protein n=1 Tax=Leptomonas seymouri TaxID=5684 RepID=A0A0N1PFH5_LEPSE|nr:hypothetical protein ABL78_0198 [Leptomonas seymouri]|eukprot:KPI90762.1 hypothetical protein ABL78_0198 [Leptomonas seymouri]
MSASPLEVTVSEAYTLWGERVRNLFATPPSFIETAVAYNPFERHECSVPLPPSLPPCDESLPSSEESSLSTATESASSVTGKFFDEALYPFCFYVKMLQSAEKPSNAVLLSPLKGDGSQEAEPGMRQQIQHLRVDEDELAARLAERLRARNRKRTPPLQHQRNFGSGNIISTFCDPKVEKQQALLHSELTDFLLSVREENRASLVLRRQLQRSRMVRGMWHDPELPSTPRIPCEEHR